MESALQARSAQTSDAVRAGWRYHRIEKRASPYLYVLPFFVLFALFGAFPLFYTMWVSLFDWDFLAETQKFIGFDNYSRLFGDYTFWNAVLNTTQILVLATVPPCPPP